MTARVGISERVRQMHRVLLASPDTSTQLIDRAWRLVIAFENAAVAAGDTWGIAGSHQEAVDIPRDGHRPCRHGEQACHVSCDRQVARLADGFVRNTATTLPPRCGRSWPDSGRDSVSSCQGSWT